MDWDPGVRSKIRARLKKISGLFLWVSTALLLSLRPVSASEPRARAPKILVVHSYHPEYPWVAAINEGIQKSLEDTGVVLETIYMDTKRHTLPKFKEHAGELARKKIDEWKPDVVIAADDNAQVYVTRNYVGKKAPLFVFCGVNAEPSEYGFPAANVTGILERPHFLASFELAQKIIPNIRRIAVISDTDATSLGALNFIQREEPPVKILDYRMITEFKGWKQRVEEYNVDADALFIYMYHTIKETKSPDAVSMDPKKVMGWTGENCKIPTVGFFEFSIEDGMLCGVAESGQEHGFEAGTMALALLNGTDIRKLPVKLAQKGISMVNLGTAKKLGITVPQDVIASVDKVIQA